MTHGGELAALSRVSGAGEVVYFALGVALCSPLVPPVSSFAESSPKGGSNSVGSSPSRIGTQPTAQFLYRFTDCIPEMQGPAAVLGISQGGGNAQRWRGGTLAVTTGSYPRLTAPKEPLENVSSGLEVGSTKIFRGVPGCYGLERGRLHWHGVGEGVRTPTGL